MKTVILAGGFGTRLSEYTDSIPKPMVPIGNKPILEHIMRTFARYGYNDFIIALGYKGNVIKKYFKHFSKKWKINLIDTGINTQTGGRVKRLEYMLKKERFFFSTRIGCLWADIKRSVIGLRLLQLVTHTHAVLGCAARVRVWRCRF